MADTSKSTSNFSPPGYLSDIKPVYKTFSYAVDYDESRMKPYIVYKIYEHQCLDYRACFTTKDAAVDYIKKQGNT